MESMNVMTEHTIAQEAGAWLFRLKEDRSAECRAEFAAWLQTSPHHVAEFLLISATDVELGALDADRRFDIKSLLAEAVSNVVPLDGACAPSPTLPHARGREKERRRWTTGIAAAAALVTSTLLMGVLWLGGVFDSQRYRTEVGEQRTIKLADSSVVQLNTLSHIQVRFSNEARLVELLEGEVLFTVAHEKSRPFVVRSGPATVQAVGTQFSVYRHADRATVSVVEGRVKIMSEAEGHATSQAPPASLLLDAGQQAAIETSGRIVKSSEPEVARALAWRQRHLEFRSATVAEVAAEFNRYNELQIRIADRSIAARRMSGLFEADQPQSLLDFLANEGGVRFETRGDAVTLYAQDASIVPH